MIPKAYTGKAKINTFAVNELLATKLRALYQRLCTEEGYELLAPPRRDRANPFASRRAHSRSPVRRSPKR